MPVTVIERREVVLFDLRPRYAMPRPPRLRGDVRYHSVQHALEQRWELIAAREARRLCEFAGAPSSRRDPDRASAVIATVGVWLRRCCTEEERLALELEIRHPDMPVAHRKAGGGRAAARTKCDVMRHALGGTWYRQRYHDVVADGFAKLRTEMRRAGVLA